MKISTYVAREIRRGITDCRSDIKLIGKPHMRAYLFSGPSSLAAEAYSRAAYRYYIDVLVANGYEE